MFRVPVLGRRIKRKILGQLGLGDVRIALTGAAPLPPPTIAWYRSLGLDLLEGYGMSENMAYSHFTRPGESRIGYVGHANRGVVCRVAGEKPRPDARLLQRTAENHRLLYRGRLLQDRRHG